MLRATKDIKLPTTIIGSLPRPSWYTENLGARTFLDAMVDIRFREQYEDAVSVYIRDQELAGLDILTDGDCPLRRRHRRAELDALPERCTWTASTWRPALAAGRRRRPRASRAATSSTTTSRRA